MDAGSGGASMRGKGASGRRVRFWARRGNRAAVVGALLLVPVVAAFFLVIAGPLARGVILGFYRVQQITMNTRFVGLGNFERVLGGTQFWNALWITLQYTVGGLVLQMVLGVGVALLLNQHFHGRALARSLAIFPYLLPIVVATTVWKWLLNPNYGIFNTMLTDVGLISQPIGWFSEPDLALGSVILVSTWRVFPFVVIAILGRLQNIPRQLYDAAATDGASAWSQFWDITLPQLRSVLIITVFLRFIWDFNDFNTIALLTGGGPAEATLTLPVLIYQLGFGQHQLGLAAAVADLTLILLSVLFVLYFWMTKPLGDQR